jgi:hypothetical protein
MKIDYTCRNEECEHEFKVSYAPKDEWTEAEISPGECFRCGTEVDFDQVEEEATPDSDSYFEEGR